MLPPPGAAACGVDGTRSGVPIGRSPPKLPPILPKDPSAFSVTLSMMASF